VVDVVFPLAGFRRLNFDARQFSVDAVKHTEEQRHQQSRP
jgi:hypothetical protein